MGSTTLRWIQRRAWLLAVAGAVLLALGSTTWWVTHPDVFDDAGGFAITTVAEKVDRAYYAGIVVPPSNQDRRELELRSATPVVVKDTAAAEVEVYLCEVDPAQGAVGVGAQRREPTDVCSTFEPVTDGTGLVVGEGEPRQQLVLMVRGTQPGVVKVRGVEISYRDGLRRGTEVTGGYLTYRAR